MFGYVRIHKPTITMGEYELYQGVYCTLCRRLGKRYGLSARMALSYDLTFLALLQMALSDEKACFTPGRCSFNPTKKCLNCATTVPIDRAADISALLTYHKLRDTVADEGFFKKLGAWLLMPLAAHHRKKAIKRYPAADARIAAMMTAQAALEAEGCASIDRAAEPFALLLQWLLAETAADDRQRLVLERLGYCLGRWVYLIDAVDDMVEDKTKSNYNPYILYRNIQNDEDIPPAKNYARLTLNACLAECVAAYNLLEVRRFDGILRNILEQGMPRAQQRVITGEDKNHEQRSL